MVQLPTLPWLVVKFSSW